MKLYSREITVLFFCSLSVSGLFAQSYAEKYRPQFHYSAPSGWVGDPCALIKHEGTYHLFTWGHAVSKDLVHWEQLPWPMKGDDGSFDYFTGSMVVDKKNTAGFGSNSMIAFYTMHNKKSHNQAQGFSASTDYETFKYYPGNPVIDIGSTEFRDPQVFWYSPQSKWIMVVALPVERKIRFYSSTDLKTWTQLSEFGQIGSQDGVWECPDFFELPVEGQPGKRKWFLSIAVGPNKQQYFTGNFDGVRFLPDPDVLNFLKKGEGMDGTVFDEFDEKNFGGQWTATGDAFAAGPDRALSHLHLGDGLVNSSASTAQDMATGTLISKPFIIQQDAINFLIAGGNYQNKTCIRLIADNRIVRSATGDSTPYLKWTGWNVSDLIGKQARLEIVDQHRGPMGHIRIDHIMFSDVLHNEHREHALWSDYGPDYYAAKSCRDFDNPAGRVTWLGWISNWEYAHAVPPWGHEKNKGMESISRQLSLIDTRGGSRLVQRVIPEMRQLRKDSVCLRNRIIPIGVTNLDEFRPAKNTYEIEAVFNADSDNVFGLNICVGQGRKLVVKYDGSTSTLFLDRTNCTDYNASAVFNQKFPKILSAPVMAENNRIVIRLFVDQSSVELFANGGKVVMTALTYPGEEQTGIQVFSELKSTTLVSLKAWSLSSIWQEKFTAK